MPGKELLGIAQCDLENGAPRGSPALAAAIRQEKCRALGAPGPHTTDQLTKKSIGHHANVAAGGA
jgi:hypothetical protein